LLASALSFAIIQLTPGGFLALLDLNPKISQETKEQYIALFGLKDPAIVQYFKWLWQVVTQFNFGLSFTYFRPVSSLLLERIPATLLMSLTSIILTWAIAIPLGILSAVKQNQFIDKFFRVISYLGQGFPSFITALLLLILAQNVSPLLPVGDMTSINYSEYSPIGKVLDIAWHMILPTIALTVTSFAAEFFFNWPGLGRLILQAVTAKDLYLVMGSLMMGATMLIIGNLLADLLLKAVDPRIKLEDLK